MKIIVTLHDGKGTRDQEFDADQWTSEHALCLYKDGNRVAEFAPHMWISVRVA